MLRLVNVEGALSLLQRKSEAPLVLEVEDDEIPENAGSYIVGGFNGDVARGARTGEQVTLNVRQLAQLYAGYLPARQLGRGGLTKPGSAKAVELLEEFFPPGDPWLFPPDHF
jgi:predicted acetyltransferase